MKVIDARVEGSFSHPQVVHVLDGDGPPGTAQSADSPVGLGLGMELQRVERGVLLDRLFAGTFEAIVSFLVLGNLGALERWAGGVGYRHPQLTRLREVVSATADPGVIDDAYRQLSNVLGIDQPITFLFRAAVPHIVHRRVKGLTAPFRANPLLFTEDLWLDDRAAAP